MLCGCSLDSLHHLFHSLIMLFFTYGISVWGIATYDKCQKIAVRFAFPKEVKPVLNLLDASDNK